MSTRDAMGTLVAAGYLGDALPGRYELRLYRGMAAPPSVGVSGRRIVRGEGYELDAWALPGGHVLRFVLPHRCVCEWLSDLSTPPMREGLIRADPIGTGIFDRKFIEPSIVYLTTVQVERLGWPRLGSTMVERLDHAHANRSLHCRWESEAGPSLTVVDVQRLRGQVHVQTYHVLAASSTVVRTQSIFEHAMRAAACAPPMKKAAG